MLFAFEKWVCKRYQSLLSVPRKIVCFLLSTLTGIIMFTHYNYNSKNLNAFCFHKVSVKKQSLFCSLDQEKLLALFV